MRAIFVFLAIGSMLHAEMPGKTQHLKSPDQVPQGLARSDWQSIRAAYEAGRHAFAPVEGGWQARNPGQQWMTKFDGRGFLATPREGGWTWGLELRSYGRGDQQTPVGSQPPEVQAAGQRLTYDWDTTLQEWWVNDQRGLEHGFIIAARPEGISNAQSEIANPLVLLLAVRGTLTPKVSADALGVLFQDEYKTTVLNYTGLRVWDANGRALPSHFESAGAEVRLLVDERDARYPVTIDPIAQQAYLKASQVTASDQFGISVAVSGDTVVVGARTEDGNSIGVNGPVNESATDSGAAYVFVHNGMSWSQQAYLKASQVTAGDEFGRSVAIDGDTIVTGAFQEDGSATGVNGTANESAANAGAAYVFIRSGTTWSQQAYLKASQVTSGDGFGLSVAVSGDTVVVGASGEDGSAVGVNGAVDELASGSGAAYVFVRSGITWNQQAYLKASQVSSNDAFGASVALSGEMVVVGASGEDGSAVGVNGTADELAPGAGAAYVFVRSGTTWSQQAYLKASQVSTNDAFGRAVAVSVETVAVGAYLEDGSAMGVNSPVDELAPGAGAAYVFVRTGTTWSQQAYLKASQVSPNDLFGISVAVSGEVAVVGADLEDGSASGIDGPVDEAAGQAGAAYVFMRSGTEWSQRAYLKASQVSAADNFGWSVAVAGNKVVVGAPQEDSGASGVNGTTDETVDASGAAYIYILPDADNDGLRDSWEQTYWSTTFGHGPLDDDDRDGYVSLLELGLGLSPTLTNPGGLPGVTQEGGYLTITLTKQPGVTYEVQTAGTLIPAQPDSFSAASTTVLINDATTLKARDNFLISGGARRFIRVQVTAAP